MTIKPPKASGGSTIRSPSVRRQTEMDGLGTVVFVRTTKEKAPGHEGGDDQQSASTLVPLNRTIARPYDTRGLTYRITVKGEEDPAAMFVQDGHRRRLTT